MNKYVNSFNTCIFIHSMGILFLLFILNLDKMARFQLERATYNLGLSLICFPTLERGNYRSIGVYLSSIQHENFILIGLLLILSQMTLNALI